MIDKIKDGVKNFMAQDYEALEMYKYSVIGFIVIDLFGIYWWLGWNKLGIAGVFAGIVCLALVLFAQRGKAPPQTSNKPTDPPDKPEEIKSIKLIDRPIKEGETTNWDMGLPDAAEYNRRMENALGSF